RGPCPDGSEQHRVRARVAGRGAAEPGRRDGPRSEPPVDAGTRRVPGPRADAVLRPAQTLERLGPHARSGGPLGTTSVPPGGGEPSADGGGPGLPPTGFAARGVVFIRQGAGSWRLSGRIPVHSAT